MYSHCAFCPHQTAVFSCGRLAAAFPFPVDWRRFTFFYLFRLLVGTLLPHNRIYFPSDSFPLSVEWVPIFGFSFAKFRIDDFTERPRLFLCLASPPICVSWVLKGNVVLEWVRCISSSPVRPQELLIDPYPRYGLRPYRFFPTAELKNENLWKCPGRMRENVWLIEIKAKGSGIRLHSACSRHRPLTEKLG